MNTLVEPSGTSVQYFLKHANGTKHGPYATRGVAEGILNNMASSSRSEYIIEHFTSSGQQVLLG